MRRVLSLCAVVGLVGCGPKMMGPVDAGHDAGEIDAGVDAGVVRLKGEDPPPSTYLTAVKLPETPGTRKVGEGLALALDQFAQPMLAYLSVDPDGDGVELDNRIEFTRWNGVDKKFQAPKVIATVGTVAHAAPTRPVALARDVKTGTLVIAYVQSTPAVRLAVSRDEGETWNLETVSLQASAEIAEPQVSMHDGTVHVAWFDGQRRCMGTACGGVVYRKRVGAAAFGAEEVAPLPAGTASQLAAPISMAIDAAFNPGLAFFASADPATTIQLAFWRPGTTTAFPVLDSGTSVDVAGAKRPSVSLAFKGTEPRLAAHLLRSENPDGLVWYREASGADGQSWKTAVAMPRNESVSGKDATHSFQAIAVDSTGNTSVAANFAANQQLQQPCGGPKISKSMNGIAFTTCSPDGARRLGYAGQWIVAASHANVRYTYAFVYGGTIDIAAGIVLWRDP